jgi:hypothetical protein
MNNKLKRFYAVSMAISAILVIYFYIAQKPNTRLLEKIGSIESPKIGARLIFTNDDPGIVIERRVSGFDWGIIQFGMTTSISPQNWTNFPGFFAVIDDDGRFWAYNGKDQTWIYERMPDGGGRTLGLQTWKGPIPPEFTNRLPANFSARSSNKNG